MKHWLKLCLVLVLVLTISSGTALSALAAGLTLPAGLKTVEEEAFEGLTAVDEIVLPEGVRSIGSRAFADSSLKSINLPMSITSIADDAFSGSPSVRATVKAGSYALSWCRDNGVAYEIDQDGVSTGGIPVSIAAGATSAAMGESVKITLTTDDGTGAEDLWCSLSIVYLNEDGEVVGAENRGYHPGKTYSFVPKCGGAVKVILTVRDEDEFCAGKTGSVEIDLTGGDTYVYYKTSFVGSPYPGGKLRVYVTAVNGEYMTSSAKVTLAEENGLLSKTLGTLSSKNTAIAVDVDIPADCVNDDGEWVTYDFTLTVGDEKFYRDYGTAAPCSGGYSLRVGETNHIDPDFIPSEMPYTYAIKDASIATVSASGEITGVKEGTTTGTLTTKSGYVCTFDVEVYAGQSGGAAGAEPVLYTKPVSETVLEGSERALFYIYSAVPDSLRLDESVDMNLNFYDDDGNLIEVIETDYWIDASERDTIWPEWDWYANRAGDYRYIELDLSPAQYEVCEPYTARVYVIRYSEQGDLMFDVTGGGLYAPGDTAKYTLTCTTPSLLKGVTEDDPVKVYPVNNSGWSYDVFTDAQPALFWEGKTTGTLSVKVSDSVVPGYGYDFPLYCGSHVVSTAYFEVDDSASVMYTSLSMLVGERRSLPLAVDEAHTPYVTYSSDHPEIASVDENGVVTALKAGETEINVSLMDVYGNRYNKWFNVGVAQPASDDMPVLTVTVDADSMEFGGTVPVTLKLSECIYDEDGDPAWIEFRLRSNYLNSAKKHVDSNSSWYDYTADELVEGVTEDVGSWYMEDSGIYKTAYVSIIPEYVFETAEFEFDYDTVVLPVENVPDPDELVYGLRSGNSGDIQQGSYAWVYVWRTQASVGSDVEVSLVDADGNVLVTGTFEDGEYQCELGFRTSDFEAGKSHTLTLMVDGKEYSDADISIKVSESRLNVYGVNSRVAMGGSGTLKYSFSADGYDCPVTFSSSDESVAKVTDGNVVSFLTTGYVTLTGTCEHGQTDSCDVVVYDPYSDTIPVFYLEAPEDSEVRWMENVEVIIGTETDLTQIPESSFSIPTVVQFLDGDGNVVYDSGDSGYGYAYLYHSLTQPEYTTRWNNSSIWLAGAEADAKYIRFDISDSAGKDYNVDPDRCTLTLPLPSLETYQYPVVVFDYTSSVEQGGDFQITFRCLNPSALGVGKKVTINNYEDGSVLDSGMLTQDAPEITLTYTVPEDFEGGNISWSYPSNGSTSTTSTYISVGKLTGISSDRKISVGSSSYVYAYTEGSVSGLKFSVADESIVSITDVEDRYAYITANAKGSTEITVSSGKTSFSCVVTVYDPDNVVVPAISFSEEQTADTAEWNKSACLNIETQTDPSDFGEIYIDYRADFLNESGEVVMSDNQGGWTQRFFALSEDSFYFSSSDMAKAYAKGARSVRVTLLESEGEYTVTGKTSVTLAIQDPNTVERPIMHLDMPAYIEAGVPFDVTLTCMNPATIEGTEIWSIVSNLGNTVESVTLTADQPSASTTFTLESRFQNYSSGSLSIRNENTSYGSVSFQILSGSISNVGALKVGNTRYVSYSLRQFKDLTLELASSNPDVATIDSDGLVTAVAPGAATITMTYGPLVRTAFVRVYDSSAEGVPTIYLFNPEPGEEVAPTNLIYAGFGVSDGVESIGSYLYVDCRVEYLNDADEVVMTDLSYSSFDFGSGLEQTTSVFSSADLSDAVVRGATKARVSLVEDESSYIIDPDRSSYTVQIADTSEWVGNRFGAAASDMVYPGREETILIRMLSASSDYAGVPCTVTVNVGDFITGETFTISTDNPTAELTFTVPEDFNSNYLYWDYTAKFEGATYDAASSSNRCTVVRITSEQADVALGVGSTYSSYYSCSVSGLEWSYESSDPDVVTVDEAGMLTAVSAGVATITVHIGEAVRSFDVRVYDPNGAFATPELYLANPDEAQTAFTSPAVKFNICTNTDVNELGGGFYAQVRYEYVDADGNRVGSTSTSSYYVAYAVDNETNHSVYLYSELYAAVAAGATHVRYSLVEGVESYTVAEDGKSILIPIKDPSEWNMTKIYGDETTVIYDGEPYTAKVMLLSYAESDAEANFIVTFNAYDSSGTYYHTDAQQTINAENPVASFDIPDIGNASYLYCKYTVKREGSSYNYTNDSWTARKVKVTAPPSDVLVSVGSSSSISYSGNNLSYVDKTFTSSNPEVATVSASGYVYGQSVGTATITVTIGKLVYTCGVRVYDSSLSYENPAFYLTTGVETAAIGPDEYAVFYIGTTTPLEEMGGSKYVNFRYSYLDEEGNNVFANNSYTSYGAYIAHAASAEAKYRFIPGGLANAVAAGATQLCVTMPTSSGYTLDEERASILIPIKDASEWTSTEFGMNAPKVAYGDSSATVSVKMLSCADADAEQSYICSFYAYCTSSDYIVNYEEQAISAENPVVSYTFDVPNGYTSLYVGYKITKDGSTSTVDSGSATVPTVYLSSNTGTLVGVGSSVSCGVSVQNSSYVTLAYESTDTDIATVNESGAVTGVAVGTAGIIVRYGDKEVVSPVRVYDSSASNAKPEISLSADPDVESLKPGDTVSFMVNTETDLSTLGGATAIYFKTEYVTDDGETLYSSTSSRSTSFVDSGTVKLSPTTLSDVSNYAASGMTGVRITLQSSSSAYTIVEGADSVLIPLADPGTWSGTNFGLGMDAGVIAGNEYTASIKLLSCSESDQEAEYTAKFYLQSKNSTSATVYYEGEAQTISAANPVAEYTFTVPEDMGSSLYVKWAVTDANGRNVKSTGKTVYNMYITKDPTDELVTVGSTTSVSMSVSNSGYLPYVMTYTSSNPEIATVDQSGTVTGVSAGVATITIRYGALEGICKVRVYDSANVASAKLSLSAPDGMTAWSWVGEDELVLTADQPVEKLGTPGTVRIYKYAYDADGALIHSTYSNYYPEFTNSNSTTILVSHGEPERLMELGVASFKYSLDSLSGANGFTINSAAKDVQLPMGSMAEYDDPAVKINGSLSSTDMISGGEYTLPIKAYNSEYPKPVTVYAFVSLTGDYNERTVLGTVTFTPSVTSEVNMVITAPYDTTLTNFNLYVMLCNADGTETELNYYSVDLIPLPSVVTAASTLAEFQSDHNYADFTNKAWSYTVEGATSLAVTFDSRTYTESMYWDPLCVGTMEEMESGSFTNVYGGSIGAITVNVEGDTAVVWLKSDASSNYWGFAVTQIVATMADGSTVTITE